MMEFKDFLIEAGEAIIDKQQGPKIWSKYGEVDSNNHDFKSSRELIDYISSKFPPAVRWLVTQYIKGNYKLDDLSNIVEKLKEFDTKKQFMPSKNLADYKSIDALYKELELVKNKTSNTAAKKNLTKEFIDNGEAEWFYRGKTIKVLIPHTEKAACFFGRSTTWCTAATKTSNFFNQYDKKGKLYIIITPDDRYQFHFTNGEFKDSGNDEINLQDFAKKYPEIVGVFDNVIDGTYGLDLLSEKSPLRLLKDAKAGHYDVIKNKDIPENVQLKLIEISPILMLYISNPTEKVKELGNLSNKNVQMRILELKRYDDFLLLDKLDISVEKAIFKKSSPLMKYIKNPSDEFVKFIAESYPMALENITKISPAMLKYIVTTNPSVALKNIPDIDAEYVLNITSKTLSESGMNDLVTDFIRYIDIREYKGLGDKLFKYIKVKPYSIKVIEDGEYYFKDDDDSIRVRIDNRYITLLYANILNATNTKKVKKYVREILNDIFKNYADKNYKIINDASGVRDLKKLSELADMDTEYNNYKQETIGKRYNELNSKENIGNINKLRGKEQQAAINNQMQMLKSLLSNA